MKEPLSMNITEHTVGAQSAEQAGTSPLLLWNAWAWKPLEVVALLASLVLTPNAIVLIVI